MENEIDEKEQIILTEKEEAILEKVLERVGKILTEENLRKKSEQIKQINRNYHFPLIDNSFSGIFNDKSKQKKIKLGFFLNIQFNRHKNVMLKAVGFDERALLFIDSRLLENDIEFAKNLIKVSPNAFIIAGKLQSDKDFCIFAIENGCHYAVHNFLKDPEVMEIAIKKDPIAMLSVPEKLRKNVDFMVDMIAKYPKCIDYFTEKESSYINLLSDCFFPGLFCNVKRNVSKEISPIKWLFDIFENKELLERLPTDMKKICNERIKQSKTNQEKEFYKIRYTDLVKSFNTSYIKYKISQDINRYTRGTKTAFEKQNDLTEDRSM